MKKVTIDQKVRILDDFFKVEQVHLRYEKFDGQMSSLVRRLNFERGDSVAAVIFNPKTKTLTLVNQFKYPTYEKGPGWITEIVAGMIDKGESPDAAIRREIMEETGYSITTLEHISTFYVSPGGSSERIILYYAEISNEGRVESGGGVASEAEDILTIEIRLDDALKKIQDGEIADAKTILGIYWLKNRSKQVNQ
ncbi:NUDIX hydrolase [Paraburkholderia sp. UCT2]|nr:NUDIX hydrolase [Paraburkholderia sp. UCT2]